MRTLCFGGSFNPIHYGHLITARAVAEAADFGQILLIPNGVPPHKRGDPEMAAPVERLTMCRIATAGSAMFAVSDIEIWQKEPCYTVETARRLRREGLQEVHWLIGSDTVSHLKNWHDATALLQEVHFWVMQRPAANTDGSTLDLPYRRLLETSVPAPQIEISATDIRQRVRAGLSIDYLTPPAVADYIRERGLYAS